MISPILSVLIQKFVGEINSSPPVSGVSHSAHNIAGTASPVPFVTIHAAVGHGEYVVEDLGDTSCYLYHLNKGLIAAEVYQDFRILPVIKDKRVHLEPIPNQPNTAAALPLEVVEIIALLSEELEKKRNYPVDIEFVYSPEVSQLYIVQIRPQVFGKNQTFTPFHIDLQNVPSAHISRF